jgi:hypothetical protein
MVEAAADCDCRRVMDRISVQNQRLQSAEQVFRFEKCDCPGGSKSIDQQIERRQGTVNCQCATHPPAPFRIDPEHRQIEVIKRRILSEQVAKCRRTGSTDAVLLNAIDRTHVK